jgi:predicted RNA methylase
MQQQHTGLKRNAIDKYYTKPDIVKLCIDTLTNHIQIRETDMIIEPSAGNGAFIAEIKTLATNCIFYDIEPEHAEITKQDFLQMDVTQIQANNQCVHVVGNPPFGRQSSLALKFIKKSCEFCETFSFILPKSFKKDSLKNKIPTNFHLQEEIDIPEMAFLVDGNEHDVPCVFQIWKKMENPRISDEKIIPQHFVFVKKHENPHISVRRVGVNAGMIDVNVEEKSVESHYFIKFTNNKSIQENVALLSGIIFEFNNTVGPKSISKQELIKKYNVVLNN